MKSLALFALATLIVSRVEASDPGTTAANFLNLGIGPRAIAMGDAQVGLADDVYATYWNPAGLTRLQVQEAGFVHTQYLEDITEQYVAYAVPKGRLGTFAGSFSYLTVGKFQGYDAVGQRTGEVGANDASLAFSYSRSFLEDRHFGSALSVGLTGKWIQERLDSVTAKAYAADAGVFLNPGNKWGEWLEGWKAGLALRNLGTPMKFDQESFNLPQMLTGGLSYSGTLWRESITLALDGRQPKDGPRSVGIGLEVWTLQTFVLRAGYTTQGDLGNGLRFGAGLRLKTLQVDYAFAGAGKLGNAHRFGLTFRFGRAPEDPLYLAQRWYEKGLHDFRKKRFTEALVEFNKALELDPSHPQALEAMKKTYEQIKIMVPAN